MLQLVELNKSKDVIFDNLVVQTYFLTKIVPSTCALYDVR